MDRDTVEPSVDTLPGECARRLVEHHHEHAAPSTYVYEFVWDHDAPAIGPFCTDADGNVLMDWTGHVGAMPLGYNNPKLLDPLSEFDLVDPTKIAGQDFYATAGEGSDLPGAADLMDRLTDISSQYDMDTVFLSNSGAEAVENAIKISYDHRRSKYGITFEGAFHGRTLGALSLNRSKSVYRRHFPEIPSIHDAPFCDDRHCTPDTCDCGFFTGDTSALRRMLGESGHVDPDEVSYLILEPIQGEGGYRFPSDAFASEVADLTTTHDIPVVVDEVQSGLGRTGEWWASDHYPIEPDVIASAKALRVGATISRSDVFPEETSRLSSTWGAGDILACAQGALTIDAIEEHDLMDNAVDRGREFEERFRDATVRLDAVADVRGKGLMLGVEFDSKARRDAVVKSAMQRGLLTIGCGHRTLRVLPPLDSTAREIELGTGLLAEAVEAVA